MNVLTVGVVRNVVIGSRSAERAEVVAALSDRPAGKIVLRWVDPLAGCPGS